MTSLVKRIEQHTETAAAKAPRTLGVYVIIDNKDDCLAEQLRSMAETEALKRVSLCIGPPPKDYEIAKEADMTVVIYSAGRRNQQKVTANFALRNGELDETKADAIVKALSDVLPK